MDPGDPAEPRMSTTYYGDRIGSFGDVPIELLRKIIAEQAAVPLAAPASAAAPKEAS